MNMSSEDSAHTAFELFAQTHRTQGLRAALAFLVRRTDYRFIGIWRFQEGKANAAAHYDRENPEQTDAVEVPDTATYCCYVRESAQPFKTSDTRTDERVTTHPARETVLTYCGVPVMSPEGEVIATLCHYDVVPRDAEQIDIELMLMVSSYLAQGGRIPPYPGTPDDSRASIAFG